MRKLLKSKLSTIILIALIAFILYPKVRDFAKANLIFGNTPTISYTIARLDEFNKLSEIKSLSLESPDGTRKTKLPRYQNRDDMFAGKVLAGENLLHIDLNGEQLIKTVKIQKSGLFSVRGDHQYTINGDSIGMMAVFVFVAEFPNNTDASVIPDFVVEGNEYELAYAIPYGNNRYILTIWNPTSVSQTVDISIPGHEPIAATLDFSDRRVLEKSFILE